MIREQNLQPTTKTAIGYEPMLALVAIDRIKDFDDKDEIYCNWYKYPSCESKSVINNDNYCSNCGCRFEWFGDYC
jgi:hypothetical protein